MIDTKHLIDVSGWGEFRVGDLLHMEKQIELNPVYAYNNSTKNEILYPFYGQSYENNGIIDYYYLGENLLNNKDARFCIMIHSNTHLAYCVNTPFYLKDGHGATTIFTNKNLNDMTTYFLICVLNTTMNGNFDYDTKATKERLNDLIIKLPIISTDEPDWDYMESYMKAVVEESEKSLENLKKADDTKHLIDVSGWGEFDVNDFFTVLSGRNKLSNVDIDDGDIPVYSSNSFNGGIFGYTTKEPDYEVNDNNPFYITFGDHTKAVNIADKSFCVMDNVKVLTTKIRNYNVLHFIITSWLRNVPDLGYARHWSVAEKAKINLPIDVNGEPNWQYMEDYMKNIMDKSEQIISDLQIGV